jgi:hypothetical protein
VTQPWLLSVGIVLFRAVHWHGYFDVKRRYRLRTIRLPGLFIVWGSYSKVRKEA